MNKENLRSVVWQALKRNHRNQFAGIHAAIKEVAAEHGITAEAEEMELAANELLWEFLTAGILAPGGNANHFDFRLLQLTDYGLKRLDMEEQRPDNDPAGYLDRLGEQVGRPIDSVVKMYIRECLLTFFSGNYLAAMVMLSGASERCLDLLIDEYGKASEKAFEAKIKRAGRSARDRFETLRADLLRAEMPEEISDTLDIQLSGLFTLVRYARNDDGGPAGRVFDRDTSHAGLLLFPQYCKRVYAVIDHLQARSVPPAAEPTEPAAPAPES